jgi:hypothetical protein
MPITQQRLRDLLEEHEACLRAIDALRTNAEGHYRNKMLDATDRVEMLYAETLLLADVPRLYAKLERRDLDRNWKKNQKLAAKQERKRRAKGIAPRGQPTDTDWVPHTQAPQPEPVVFTDEDEAAYAAFNAQGAAPLDDEAAQCMRELGLTEPPSPSLLESWREGRNGPRQVPRNPWGEGEGEVENSTTPTGERPNG